MSFENAINDLDFKIKLLESGNSAYKGEIARAKQHIQDAQAGIANNDILLIEYRSARKLLDSAFDTKPDMSGIFNDETPIAESANRPVNKISDEQIHAGGEWVQREP